ncbi:hypothetical protein Z517_09333 [Fonsecaea pedrosoi CBS 271.37]|uniref:Uncharacterized protein n=1 Tax=Fonsecaea pedrosoi CBS 271.37 TaxID=1442368 RepID=A0A0D2GX16_9EURO|nr:uncharacterized protein Z517_09333 [Fonsecaea pedrosoi CBS 271.37]KIW76889.1 hypothetical protein Z517_09333 [Fonsecaea pedrosoi CBS 271.37]
MTTPWDFRSPSASARSILASLRGGWRTGQNPREAHYALSAVYELHRAGVLDDVKAQGIHPNAVYWRHPDGTFIASIRSRFDMEFPMDCLPLDQLDILPLRHPPAQPENE